jgi:hypothetical protein
MKFVRSFLVLLPIALVVVGCERRSTGDVADRPAGPVGVEELAIVDSRWITDRTAIEAEVARASGHPLIQRTIAESPHPRLTRYFEYSIRLEGSVSDGSSIGATVLPYMVDQDPTHAVFATLLERDGTQISEYSELIVGREPTSLETGFRQINLGGQLGWIKSSGGYLAAGALGAGGAGRDGWADSPARRQWTRFIECWLSGAGQGCSVGAAIGRMIAPGFPYSAAIGCGVGVLAVGGGCALEYLR